MEDIFKQISPNLTLYSVLVAFAVTAFKLFHHFQDKEKELREEFLEKVASLKQSFKETLLNPVMAEIFNDIFVAGSSSYFITLMDRFYIKLPEKSGPRYTKKNDSNNEPLNFDKVLFPEVFEDILKIQIDEKKGNGEKYISEFFYESKYVQLTEKLDSQYERLNAFTKSYFDMEKYCNRTSYSTLVLFICFVLGFLSLIIIIPSTIIHFWIFLILQLLIIAIISFVLMEINRKKLLKNWERLTVYNEI